MEPLETAATARTGSTGVTPLNAFTKLVLSPCKAICAILIASEALDTWLSPTWRTQVRPELSLSRKSWPHSLLSEQASLLTYCTIQLCHQKWCQGVERLHLLNFAEDFVHFIQFALLIKNASQAQVMLRLRNHPALRNFNSLLLGSHSIIQPFSRIRLIEV